MSNSSDDELPTKRGKYKDYCDASFPFKDVPRQTKWNILVSGFSVVGPYFILSRISCVYDLLEPQTFQSKSTVIIRDDVPCGKSGRTIIYRLNISIFYIQMFSASEDPYTDRISCFL